MTINSADYIASYPRESLCPTDGLPEFAVIGRSNVGKSSLINMLTQRKGLAKVSGTPGKTQMLNYFQINKNWYLVDLPGYGYAKVSKKKQSELARMIEGYFAVRMQLALAFVLIDINVPPTQIDINFVNKMGELQVPFAIIFTKCDKIGETTIQNNAQAFLDAISEYWENLPPHFLTSSEKTRGRDEILHYIEKALRKS